MRGVFFGGGGGGGRRGGGGGESGMVLVYDIYTKEKFRFL